MVLPRRSGGELRAQLFLEHLAGGVAGDGVEDLHLLGQLLHHEVVALEKGHHVLEAEWSLGFVEGDHGTAALTDSGVGQADDGHIPYGRVREQQVLDLLGTDVLAISNNYVLEPSDDGEESLLVEGPQVTGLDVTVF